MASITRRTFVQTLGSIAALSVSPTAFGSHRSPRFGFVAADDAIHVFSIAPTGKRTRLHTIVSPAAAALALSPDQRFLYVANAVATFDHRPTGSVEAYGIHPRTGTLTLLNRQPLALFSTSPTSLTISPNGHYLAVASAAIDLLPLHPDGSLGRLTASMKPIGSGARRPRVVFFRDDATLLASCPDADRGHIFAVEEQGGLALLDRDTALSSREIDLGRGCSLQTALMPRRT